jgi:arylesterase/paraoxonase
MRRRLILAVLAAVIVAILWQVGKILVIGGLFRGIDPHFAGVCRLLPGPVGPEDLTIHPATGVAYISAADRRALAAGTARPGGIWRYDLNDPDAVPVNLTPAADESFQPHGISLWVDDAGPDVLFVINHPPPAAEQAGGAHHTVEIFDVAETGLVHRASLTHPLMVMPNDLVAVGRDRFYLTNTHRHAPGVMQDLETYLQLAGAQVLFYGPGGFRPALEDMVLPNGINVSADGRTLYVAAVTERSVLVYDRDPATETLRLRERVFIDTGPDNIEVAADGTLWIGAHPKLLALQSHGADASTPAPAQVVRVRATATGYAVDEVYLNDGSQFAAASAAAVRGTRLLIGQIFGDGILDCEMAAAVPGSVSDE